jgi:lathosterol oxidase
VLDLLFGTFFMPGQRWPKVYGVHNNDVPESYLAQWVYPFLRPKHKAEATTPDEES